MRIGMKKDQTKIFLALGYYIMLKNYITVFIFVNMNHDLFVLKKYAALSTCLLLWSYF